MSTAPTLPRGGSLLLNKPRKTRSLIIDSLNLVTSSSNLLLSFFNCRSEMAVKQFCAASIVSAMLFSLTTAVPTSAAVSSSASAAVPSTTDTALDEDPTTADPVKLSDQCYTNGTSTLGAGGYMTVMCEVDNDYLPYSFDLNEVVAIYNNKFAWATG